MGGKKKYIEMFGSFTEPFKYLLLSSLFSLYRMPSVDYLY